MRKISFEKTYAKDTKAFQKKLYSFDQLEMIIGEMQTMNGIMGGGSATTRWLAVGADIANYMSSVMCC